MKLLTLLAVLGLGACQIVDENTLVPMKSQIMVETVPAENNRIYWALVNASEIAPYVSTCSDSFMQKIYEHELKLIYQFSHDDLARAFNGSYESSKIFNVYRVFTCLIDQGFMHGNFPEAMGPYDLSTQRFRDRKADMDAMIK